MEQMPMVSVVMITYNHEDYIAEAMNGVFIQQSDFEIELIIANDKSTDHTDKVVNNVIQHTKISKNIKVRYYNHQANKGMMSNFIWALEQAKGKYLALCEGDDYWTDPHKLQKQVDFLEENTDYSLCFHNANVFYEDKSERPHLFAKIETRDYSGIEIYDKWVIPTASVVFNKDVFYSKIYKKVQQSKKLIYGDTPLFMAAATCGKIHGIVDVMSVYRKNNESVSSNFLKHLFKFCLHNKTIGKIFGKEYIRYSKVKVSNAAAVRSLSLLKKGKLIEAFKFFIYSFSYTPYLTLKKILKTL